MKIRKNIKINPSGFVFNESSGDSYTINKMGLEILFLLRKGKSKEEIIEHLIGEYETTRSTVEKDISEFFLLLNHYQLTK